MDAGGGNKFSRDSDLGDDSPMSHTDEHSDHEDDMRDCDSSDEGVNVNQNNSMQQSMDFGRSPDHHNLTDNHLSQHFGSLGVLGNLTALNMSSLQGLQGLQTLQHLQHGDVLEKLKMQVRDMKVNLMAEQDFNSLHSFGGSLSTPPNTSFTVPQLSNQPQNLSQAVNGFPFSAPNIPCSKDGNPGSNSSTSSETSNSSQQNNGWSFEEQYKQVRQLYEINDDPKRKEFLDDLFSFMQKRGSPINRLPIMAKSVLDLYELYNLVIARGGLVDVINKKLWQEIIKGLHLPSSITSAAFTLRTQYMKYLYPYECEKKNLSSPSELQAAIDGNRREGRRSSYGQFDSQLQGQLQMVQRSPVPSGMQQMSPLSLVTHGGSAAAAAAAAHHRLMGGGGGGVGRPSMNQMSGLVPHEIEQRMIEYIKLLQAPNEPRRNDLFSGSQSPDITPRDALNALEMSRVALWSMYNNNTSPPTSINTSPPGAVEPQREALNLAESPPPAPHIPIKRERNHPHEFDDRDFVQPPPAKRGHVSSGNGHNNHSNMHNLSGGSIGHLNSSMEDREDRSSTPTNINNNNHLHHLHHGSNKHGGGISNGSIGSVDRDRSRERDHHSMERSPNVMSDRHHSQNSLHNGRGGGGNVSDREDRHHERHNGSTENGSTTISSGMQFKISSRGNASTGDQQLVVAMEFNGILYEGVLFANQTTPTALDNTASATPLVNPSSPTPPIMTTTSIKSSSSPPMTTIPQSLITATSNNNPINDRVPHPMLSS